MPGLTPVKMASGFSEFLGMKCSEESYFIQYCFCERLTFNRSLGLDAKIGRGQNILIFRGGPLVPWGGGGGRFYLSIVNVTEKTKTINSTFKLPLG